MNEKDIFHFYLFKRAFENLKKRYIDKPLNNEPGINSGKRLKQPGVSVIGLE